MQSPLIFFLCAFFSSYAFAQVNEITLPADNSRLLESTLPGYAIAQRKCGICHSADYINFQPPGMSLTQWTAEMNKMQHSYGAPLAPAEIAQLGTYLAVAYGSASATDPAIVALTNSAEAASVRSDSAASAENAAVPALLTRNGCLGCHAIDQKVVGPGFKEVATRYKNKGDALATLEASIRNGGSGKWGNAAMPPMPDLSAAELTALARFVMGQ
ncbi:MAG: c-type cytochrome [Halioglobus sp.]|nr:c-type cytochrome [Halioglobus sp.]